MKLKWKVAVILLLLPVCTLMLLLGWTNRSEQRPLPLAHGDQAFDKIVDSSANFAPLPPAPQKGVYSGANVDSLCSDLYWWSNHPTSEPVPVCGSQVRPIHSIKCYKSSFNFPPLSASEKAILGINSTSSVINVKCTLENLAVSHTRGQHYISKHLRPSVSNELTPSLMMNIRTSQCPVPTLKKLMLSTRSDDYMLTFVKQGLNSKQVDSSSCKRWINTTAYFFVGSEPHNVYFIFLTYYSIYQTISQSTGREGNKLVVRFSGDPNRKFKEFEKKLFPGLTSALELNTSEVVCFRKVIVVPRCYNTLPFQCVENKDLKKVCLKCAGHVLERIKHTREMNSLQEFRTNILNVCGIEREERSSLKRVLFIRRKPYVRERFDSPGMFERVLSNEEEIISKIPENFPSSQLSFSATYMEDFDICTQIRMAHSADILIGVHGAGLVHLWWMKEDGWVLELVPKSKEKRRTYQTLSAMVGRNYRSISCLDGGTRNHLVTADVKDIVEALSIALQPNS